MSDDLLLDISNDGIVAGHPERISRPKLIAPSTGEEFNTIEPLLITVGCALVPDHQFEFGSSFIRPQARASFRRLVRLLRSKPNCPLSVFGHADPVGRDNFNKELSGRRAMAVYAVLVRDTEIWERKLYRSAHGEDDWRIRSVQIILDTLGFPPGEITGRINRETRDAVEAFQREHDDLGNDRDPGPDTRRRLFELYMDYLCSTAADEPHVVPKEQFIAKGTDTDGKADYQGCGEFNPVLLFSEEEHTEFKKSENEDARNEANSPNRRVLVFLFREGTRVDPAAWPCPAARNSGRGCRRRFWSDGDERRTRREPEARRNFQDTEDTFACRFYHGIAAYSPCETALKLWVLRLQVDGPDGKPVALAGRRFVLVAGDTQTAPTLRGTTDDRGILRIPVFSETMTMSLKLDVSGYLTPPPENADAQDDEDERAGEPFEDEDKFWSFTLKGGALLPIEQPGEDPALQRLYNLGYGLGRPEEWPNRMKIHAIKSFQHDHGIEERGGIDAETREAIKTAHGS